MFYTILTDGTFIKVVADKVVQGGLKVLKEFIYRSITLVEFIVAFYRAVRGIEISFEGAADFVVGILSDFGRFIHSLF
jgi:hypothetical protein